MNTALQLSAVAMNWVASAGHHHRDWTRREGSGSERRARSAGRDRPAGTDSGGDSGTAAAARADTVPYAGLPTAGGRTGAQHVQLGRLDDRAGVGGDPD